MVCIDINDAQNVSDTDQYQMSVTSSVNRGGEPGAASKELLQYKEQAGMCCIPIVHPWIRWSPPA